jgi:anti-sigma-K factor RskA
MSSPPSAPGHTRDFEELAGLAALRVLDGDDLAAFQQHAATCQRCQALVRVDRETVQRLGLTAAELDASPGFKERLLQRAAADFAERQAPAAREPPPPEPTPLRARPVEPRARPTVVPFWRRPAWAASLAAVFVLLIGGLGGYAYMNQAVTSVELTGSLQGSATVVVRRSGAAEIELHGVPDPPPGQVYEAWIIPPDRPPVPAGESPRGEGRLPLSGPVRGTTVAMTIEFPGATAPSMAPLAAANVQA